MSGEISLFGVFAPSALVWAIGAGLLIAFLRNLLQRTGLYRLVWHPGLFDLALFVLIWSGIAALADTARQVAWP
jgi:hypothetical protein